MRPSSAKAKGRRHQQRIVRDLLELFPELKEDDIRSTSMGAPGEDVLLSPRAQSMLPFSFEAKNCERLNIWSAIEQASHNASGRTPCVVFTKNRSEVYAVIPWIKLLNMMRPEKQGGVDLRRVSTLLCQAVDLINGERLHDSSNSTSNVPEFPEE